MDIDTFASHLSGVRDARGGIQALCPAHEDTNPSLSVTEGQSGLLVYCQSQHCPIEKIMDKLGLPMKALFYDDRSIAPRQPVAIYRYVDEQGWLLYEMVRFPPKDFRSRHLGPDGKWVWNLNGCRKVLYNLDKLVVPNKGIPIFWVEGEKDADRLTSMGRLATTCLGGAKKLQANYVKYFVDRDVWVPRDNDEPGHEHAEMIRDALDGVAYRVRVFDVMPEFKGADISDHLDEGYGLSQLKEVT